MNKLREIRKENHLHLKDIANFLDVSTATVCMYENGSRDMSTNTLIALSKYLNVSTDYLLGISPLKNPNKVVNLGRLRELRLEKKLLQSDVAKVIGKTDRMVGFYETGVRDPSTETLSLLADFFGVSTDYLLGKSDIRNPEELKNVQFANSGGLDVEGLDDDELAELQKQIDYMKWKKENGKTGDKK